MKSRKFKPRWTKSMLPNKDYLSKIIIFFVIVFMFLSAINLDVNAIDDPEQQWIKVFNKGETDKAYSIAIDSNDCAVITGFSKVNSVDKCIIIKYSPAGDKLLEIISNSVYESYGYDIEIDSYDNIIVCGCIDNVNSNNDYFIIKYDSGGNELWKKIYDSGGDDIAYGVSIDSQNNIIVTGQASNNYHTRKYDQNGNQLWNITYVDNPGCANGIIVDKFDNIIVTGYILVGNAQGWHTIKYGADGSLLWSKTYSNGKYDSANAISVDSKNNVVVAGLIYYGSNSNMDLIKYDENGNEVFHSYYDNSVVETANDIIINQNDDIYIVGTVFQTFKKQNYALVKFDSNGDFLWETFYDRESEEDSCMGLACGEFDKIIITGFSMSGNGNYDIVTLKYEAQPIANFFFNPLQPTILDTVEFTDSSFDSAGYIVKWEWDFGDGSTSNDKNPVHRYQNHGKFTVRLMITDDGGNIVRVSKQIEIINMPPVADFNYKVSDSIQDLVIFNDSSNDPDGQIVSWYWDLGDGNSLTDRDFSHQYSKTGIYNVSLKVIDDYGDSNIKNITITTIPPSKVNGLKVADAKNGKLDLSWNANNDDTPIDHYNIYRDDSFVTTTSNIKHRDTGLKNGQKYTYQISAVNIYNLEGERSDSCSGTPTKSSSPSPTGGGGQKPSPPPKNDKPVADASAGEPYSGFIGEDIIFIASNSYDPDGFLISYLWNFGDGSDGQGEIVTHKYSTAGEYEVILTVKDNFGIKDSTTVFATISNPNTPPTKPIIDGPYNGEQDVSNMYTIKSTDVDGDNLIYHIDWGDGTKTTTDVSLNGTSAIVYHKWMESGRFTVEVYSTDNKVESEKAEITVFIDAVEIMLNETAIGYIIDQNSDGIYDAFYNYENQDFGVVINLFNWLFLIDLDNDGTIDYTYESEIVDTNDYTIGSAKREDDENPLYILPWLFFLLLSTLFFILFYIKKRKKSIRFKLSRLKTMLVMIPLIMGNMFRPRNNTSDKKIDQDESDDKEPEDPMRDIESFVDNLPDID